MPKLLPDRLLSDSIHEFRQAAMERFEDARRLAEQGRRTAAVYLWGYVAELTLKSAWFTLIGFAETDPMTENT